MMIPYDSNHEITVPFREISLNPSALEDPVRVYDTSGPFTDGSEIDLEEGIKRVR